MNVAALTKLRLLPTTSAEMLLNYISKIIWQERFAGHIETALYLSQHDTQEFYLLNWWQSNADLGAALDSLNKAGILAELKTKVKILEHHTFDLIREYRRLPQPIQSSHIRLVTYPQNYPTDHINQMLDTMRQIRLGIPEIVGTWVGRHRGDKQIILYRADWASVEAQQTHLNSRVIQEMQERYAAEGILSDYPSFNLQLLLELEPGTKPGN